MIKQVLVSGLFFGFCTHMLWAKSYPRPAGQPWIGQIQAVVSQPGDTIKTLARTHDIGFDELHHANPKLSTSQALPPGTVIMLPTFYILPQTLRRGIVINLPEKRMFVFGAHRVDTFPVGIGRQGWATPEGTLFVTGKKANPHWHVPKAVLEAQKANGNDLPEIIPPGPDNPLGKYAIRLSKTNYLIHGTNEPDGVGTRSSAGCLRMYPKDIKQLFHMVKHRTRVHIINRPFKIARIHAKWYLESHAPLHEDDDDRNAQDGGAATPTMTLPEAMDAIQSQIKQVTHLTPDMRWIKAVLIQSTGMPIPIHQSESHA